MSDDTFIVRVSDDDYQVTLSLNPNTGSQATVPPAGQTTLVDGAIYDSETPYPIGAFPGPGHRFEFWTGDIHLFLTLDPMGR